MKIIASFCLTLILVLALSAAAETLVIPGSVEVIEEEAFCGVTAAQALILGEGVRRVESRAFSASGIREVLLPASLLSIADDAFWGSSGLTVRADEGSYAWNWALRMGYMERTPFAASPKKDFSSFAAAREMVETACLTEWEGAGRIRYVEQFGGARTYVPAYWVSASDASGSCTRAAGSMAASYMGINALPRAAADFTKFQTYMKSQGCAVQTDTACALSTFVSWYDEYARDESGAVSPVVIYTEYGSSRHAFVVIGRDAVAHDTFYIADSGTSSYVSRVKLAAEDGTLYVDQYELSTGKTDTRYGKAHKMLYTWRYVRR